MPTAVFSGVLKTISTLGINSANDKDWGAKFMLSLAKAKNFEMTLMFAGDEDNKNIEDIVNKIKQDDAKLADEVNAKYTAE